jgi:hypothetical protein
LSPALIAAYQTQLPDKALWLAKLQEFYALPLIMSNQKTSHSKSTHPCAYCGQYKKLTKEHIWPKSIIRRVGERLSYNPKAGKFLRMEMVISDVCGTCNNGALSDLDAYGASLYDRYFAHYYKGGEPIEFSVDFQKLAKWLLKLSYNAARVNESDHKRLSLYAPFLLNADMELPDNFSIAVDLVLPELVESHQEPFLPESNRICRINFTQPIDDWCTVRLVAINSFYFWILIQDLPDDQVNWTHAHAVVSALRGTALHREVESVLLTSSGAKISELHTDWARVMNSKKVL